MKKFDMLKITVITLSLILILIPIYTYGAGRWEQIDGEATDIGVGADGSVWVIGGSKTEINDGYGIYRLSVRGWEQIDKDGGAIRIDVDPSGNPWVVDKNENIFRRSGDEWEQIDGEATDIGIGGEGSVWIVGTEPRFGGYVIYRWDGRNWEIVSDDGAVQISVDNRGAPWVLNSEEYIYVWKSFNWKSIQEYFGIIFKR